MPRYAVHALIWRPVYKAYRQLARDLEISITDLLNAILYQVAVEGSTILKVALMEGFGLSLEDANFAALQMKEYAEKMLVEMEKGPEEMEEVVRP